MRHMTKFMTAAGFAVLLSATAAMAEGSPNSSAEVGTTSNVNAAQSEGLSSTSSAGMANGPSVDANSDRASGMPDRSAAVNGSAATDTSVSNNDNSANRAAHRGFFGRMLHPGEHSQDASYSSGSDTNR